MPLYRVWKDTRLELAPEEEGDQGVTPIQWALVTVDDFDAPTPDRALELAGEKTGESGSYMAVPASYVTRAEVTVATTTVVTVAKANS